MDANRQRFWLLADGHHWTVGDGAHYDPARRVLRLASARADDAVEDRALAEQRLAIVPATMDTYGHHAVWRAGVGDAVGAVFAGPAPDDLVELGGLDFEPTDLCLGHDDVAYVPGDGALHLFDLRERFEPVRLEAPGFVPWRVAAMPREGAVALDRANRRLHRTFGRPLPHRPGLQRFGPAFNSAPHVWRPDPENPNPPRLAEFEPGLGGPLDAGLDPVALALSPAGRIAVAAWRAAGDAALVVVDGFGEIRHPPLDLRGVESPWSIAWLDDRRIAVMTTGRREARVFEVPDAEAPWPDGLDALGDRYPLQRDVGGAAGPFAHTVQGPPHYPDDAGRYRPLSKLPFVRYAQTGVADGRGLVFSREEGEPPRQPLDGGDPRTVWHRIQLEASIPPGCRVVVELAADDDPTPPTAGWHGHVFGAAEGEAPGLPRGVWVDADSEVPFAPPLLDCPRVRDRSGLFTALAQRTGRATSALRGRFLHVRVWLGGTGRATPEVGALRLYASRFSYVENYLPALYHEQRFGPDADAPAARVTPADFLERFLGNIEGVLTPIEDRIGAAHLLTTPERVPAASLDWLASWVGLALDPSLPERRRRAMLAASAELHRRRGTKAGLEMAIDLATGGAVRAGAAVVVEHWRLRRTFATLLGVRLDVEDDPLLPGLHQSANSLVGDTLILGDETRREFLAVFAADLDVSTAEAAAIEAFFADFAWRVTVLVQREAGSEVLRQVRRLVELETPAHVEATVVSASHPLIVGLRALVGVDTYPGRAPEPDPVRLDHSRVGVRDVLRTPASLDPRLEGGSR